MKISFYYFIELVRHHKRKILVLLFVVVSIILLLLTLFLFWELDINNKIHLLSVGKIYTLNIEVQVDILDWGTVYPGTVVSRTLNVTSKSNIESLLIIKPMNWVFYDSQGEIVEGPMNKTGYMSMAADLNETLMRPNETVEVTLTLKVANSNEFIDFLIGKDVETFSFDILIYLSKPI